MAVITGTVVAAAGVAVSAHSASQARGQASRAGRRQRDAQAQQLATAQEQRDLAQGRYDEWRDMFMPGFESMRDMAFDNRGPDYDSITADVGSAYGAAADGQRRQLMRYGQVPGSGASEANERGYGLGRALATVQGRNVARNQHTQDQWNRMAAFANAGNGMRQGADGMMQAAYSGIYSAFGGQAGVAGQQQQQYGAQANQHSNDAMGWLGYGVGNLQSNYGTGASQQPQPIPVSGPTRQPPPPVNGPGG